MHNYSKKVILIILTLENSYTYYMFSGAIKQCISSNLEFKMPHPHLTLTPKTG